MFFPGSLNRFSRLSSKALETPYKTFGALNNADMTFAPAETIRRGKEGTDERHLSSIYARSRPRPEKKRVYQSCIDGYEAHANMMCELIQGQVQSHLFVARARKFKDCREAALFPNCIDSSGL